MLQDIAFWATFNVDSYDELALESITLDTKGFSVLWN